MVFKYRARSNTGEIIENVIEAADQQQAMVQLKATGMLVISLTSDKQVKSSNGGFFSSLKSKPKTETPKSTNPLAAAIAPPQKPKTETGLKSLLSMDLGALFNTGHVPLKTLMVFFRQLATMEGAGLSLTASLDMIASGEKNYTLRHALMDVKSRLDRGIPLSQAMAAHKCFSPLIIALIQAGEEGGLLGQALDQGATLLEKQEALHSKIRSAMFYPAFICFFAVAVLIFFFIFLVPKFEETFDALSIELPQITLTMFAIGNWFGDHWPIIVGAVALFVGLWIFLSNSKGTKGMMDRFKLKIPIMKDLILKSASSLPFAVSVCKSFTLNVRATALSILITFASSTFDLKLRSIFVFLPVLITPVIVEASSFAV